MAGTRRRAPLAAVALACAGVAAVAALVIDRNDPDAPPSTLAVAAAPTTTAATTTGAMPSDSVPTSPVESTAGTTTTTEPGFVDGEDARLAAEGLIAAYIQSEFGTTVTDVACSVPPTGDAGERFVCYALQPNDLVIALRATIGEDRLIELELLFDQTAPTTTATTATTAG
jgi:hypothetical protein